MASLEFLALETLPNHLTDSEAEQQPKRRRVSKSPPSSEPSEPVPLPYQHLTAVSRQVPRPTIEAKWSPLPTSTISQINNLLTSASRPITVRISDEQRRLQSTSAISTVSRRLISKISKGLPFPPPTSIKSTIDDDFDFEKCIDRNRALDAILTPALHANALLQAELEKEQAALEAEKDALATLESNARGEASRRKRVTKKSHHVLLRAGDEDTKNVVDELKQSIGLRLNSNTPSQGVVAPSITTTDEALEHMLESGLMGHVQSLQSNAAQVQGLSAALARGEAVVKARLLGRVERGVYEDVVLG